MKLTLCIPLAALAALAQAPPARHVTDPDMGSLVKRVVTPKGFMDPLFPALMAGPSVYYSDFFGVQAIRDVSVERIKKDFAAYAEVVNSDDHSLELKFPAGWTAKFCSPCSFRFQGKELPYSQVTFSGDTWRDFAPHVREFHAILRANKLETDYLIPNPYYADELVTARNLGPDIKLAPVTLDAGLAKFKAGRDAVLIFPDPVHGDLATYDKFVELLKTADYDWIGLEMLASDAQEAATAFVKAAEGSPAYTTGREGVMKGIWPDRFVKGTPPAENRYLKLVELARSRKKMVYGLEGVAFEYFIFRYGETPFGAGVRNYLWAKRIPSTGRGIVFGGSAHFTDATPINFQDFVRLATPNRPLVSLTPIAPRVPK